MIRGSAFDCNPVRGIHAAPCREDRNALSDAFHLRDAAPEDAVAAIYNESIAAGDSTMDTVPRSVDVVRRQTEGLSEREPILLLEVDGLGVGWGIIKRYGDRAGYRYCCEVVGTQREIGYVHGRCQDVAILQRVLGDVQR